jgi:3-keto steroid reductase
MSSLSTFLDPGDYNPEDIPLTASQHPYQDSKYQIELLATSLNRKRPKTGPFHLVVEPGIIATGLDQFNNRGLWRVLRSLTFISVSFTVNLNCATSFVIRPAS